VWDADSMTCEPDLHGASEKGNLNRKNVITRKTAVAVNFHQLETPKTSHPVVKKW